MSLERNNLYYKNFWAAVIISSVISIALFVSSYVLGKQQFFLLLNNDLGKGADFFFNYFTYMGDGLLWILWLVVVLVRKRKDLLSLIIPAFIFTTAFTQVFKYVILPDELRPSKAIADITQIHFVQGVIVHATSSFPSGHTATAFTFLLLMALTMRKRMWMFAALIVAMLVGYSRIYLGQHFPLDVAAGIVVAILSVSLSVLVNKKFSNRRATV